MDLTPELKTQYVQLFKTLVIRNEKVNEVTAAINTITAGKSRYETVGNQLGIPWYFIGVIHFMESACNFKTHLHNGDPLTAKTTHVPKDRPTGNPPFTWEVSAADALQLRKLNTWKDWSTAGLMFQLENYNGIGYRLHHPHVLSPYLWSYSNHYTKGKYSGDGIWDDNLVSKQCGAAVILRRMRELGSITFSDDPVVIDKPLVFYSKDSKTENGEKLQVFLNQFTGIFVKVDGWPGDKTSDAFKAVTGYYLKGDPRAGN